MKRRSTGGVRPSTRRRLFGPRLGSRRKARTRRPKFRISKYKSTSTTVQRDSKFQFRARGSRLGWFEKKVRSIELKAAALQVLVRNSSTVLTWGSALGTPVQQTWFGCYLYSANGVQVVGPNTNPDFSQKNDLAQIIGTRTGFTRADEVWFQNAVMDVSVRNPDEFFATVVDIFEWQNRSTRIFSNLEALVATATNEVATPGSGSSITINNRGVTPFEMPAFLSEMKIIKKQRFVIPPIGTITYQMRDNSKFNFDVGDIPATESQFNLPYRTKGIIAMVYSAGRLLASGDQPQLGVACTKTYRYKVLQNNRKTAVETG